MPAALTRILALVAAISSGTGPVGSDGPISELRLEYSVTRSSPMGQVAASEEFGVPPSYFSKLMYEFSMHGIRWKSVVRDHWHVKSLGPYSFVYDGKVYARAQPGNLHEIHSNDELQGQNWQHTKLFSDPYLDLLMFQLPDRTCRLGQPLDSVLTTTLPTKGDSITSAALIGTFHSKWVTGGTTSVYAATLRGSILLTKTEDALDKRVVCCTTFSNHQEMLGIYWPTLIERAWYCNPKGSLVRGDATGKISNQVVAIERYEVTQLQERVLEAHLQVELPPGAFIQDHRYQDHRNRDKAVTNPVSYLNPVTPERIRESYATRAKFGNATFRASSAIYEISIAALLAVLALLARHLWSRRQTTSASGPRV